MSEDQQHRPTGKRQLAGTATTSSAAYTAKRAPEPRDEDKPGGGVAAFPGEVVSEMKKVVWPTGKEMVQYTLVTFAFLIVLTALVWSVDTLTGLGVEAVLAP
ncbi:preprotein translocase subunit SecE [Corynebacterium lizhenjunii]|uniref:Protein translocase subunit SecE n=1 Tax=Corynebacterium lizhenjunii TaxID=2709394 RepID=A0A7T0KER3_9CORY|nr:preprotein translocase subunit SecE [Corynebacterium lizhenjunii]QPK79448.1 preprotein translocase subunit SecE [Corynebacterium lizhenjunii]